MKTEKSVFEPVIIGTNEFKVNVFLKSLQSFANQVNAKLIPLCQSNGIELNTPLFQKIMGDCKTVRNIFLTQIEDDILKVGASQFLRSAMVEASESITSEFEKVVTELQKYENGLSHSLFMMVNASGIYPKITILGGKAVINPESIKEIQNLFTSVIATPEQLTTFETLQALADGFNTLRTLTSNSPNRPPEIEMDWNYFETSEDGTVIVNHTVISCF